MNARNPLRLRTAVALLVTVCLLPLGLFTAPASAATTAPARTLLTFATPGDTNGLFYWLGTAKRKSSFSNPVVGGETVASSTAALSGSYTVVNLTDRQNGLPYNSINVPGAWVAWNFGETKTVEVATYTLRGRSDAPSHMPISWKVEGSNDGTAWTTIDQRTNDRSLSASSWSTFTLPSSSAAFTQLRIVQTGPNSSGADYFVIGEVEFYGAVTEVASSVATCDTPGPVPASATDPSAKLFECAGTGDANGLFHWLGTQRGAVANFSNPALNGAVAVSSSGAYSTSYDVPNLTDRADGLPFNSTNLPGSWVSWDLGKATSMEVTRYTLKGRPDAPSHLPLSWDLEGSNDGTTWTLIDRRVDDKTVKQGAWSVFDVPAAAGSFSRLRLTQTAVNSSGAHYFLLGEVEFYGAAVEIASNLKTCAAPLETEITPNPDALTTTELVCANAGDGNGLFHWLGTDGGTAEFANPVRIDGPVVNSASSVYSSTYGGANLTDRADSVPFNSVDAPNSWVGWDLSETGAVHVNRYTLKGRPDAPSHMPLSWDLEGSNDGSAWTLLDRRVDDAGISQKGWGVFDVAADLGSFRHLRITQTAANSSGANYFVLGEAEFYGVYVTLPPPPPPVVVKNDVSMTVVNRSILYGATAVGMQANLHGETTVREGEIVFTVLDADGNVVGTPLVAPVLGGEASGRYELPGGIALGQYVIDARFEGTANYSPAYGTGTVSVRPAPLTVTAENARKTYKSDHPVITVTYDGLVNGDTPASLPAPVLETTATFDSPVGVYPVMISGVTSDNYDITLVDGRLFVDPAPLTVTVDNSSRLYGEPNPAFTVSYSGFLDGEGPADLSGTLEFITGAGAKSAPGSYLVSATGLWSDHYAITYVDGTLSIGPGDLIVTVDDASKRYGSANPEFTVTYEGLAVGETPESLGGELTFTTDADASSAVGSYEVRAGGLTSDKYSIRFVSGTLDVVPAPLEVTVNDATRKYGEENPAFSVAYEGFVNGDGPGHLSGSLVLHTSAVASSPAGEYAIEAEGLLSRNYLITFVSGVLTVTPTKVFVTVVDSGKVYGAANPEFTVTYDGLAGSDGPASLQGTLEFHTVATELSKVGAYAVTAGGLWSPNYEVVYVDGTLTVAPARLFVTADDFNRAYGTDNPVFTAAYAGLVNGDTAESVGTLVLSTSADTASAAGSYAIVPSGLVSSDYDIVYVNGTLTVTAAKLVVAADSVSRVYGAENPVFTATFTGLVNGDTPESLGALALTTVATTTSPAGRYAIVPSGLNASNYEVEYVDGTLTVTPALLTVKVNDSTKVYGAPLPGFGATYEGLVHGDDGSWIGPLTFLTDATAASPVGSYRVGVDGIESPNYVVTIVPGTLTVTPAELVITADDKTKRQGDENPAFTATYSGLVNGDSVANLAGTLVFETPAARSSAPGTYPITPSGVSSANYAITFVPGTLTVTPVVQENTDEGTLPPPGDGAVATPKKGGRTIPIKWEMNQSWFDKKAAHTWRIERRQIACDSKAAVGAWQQLGATNNKDVMTDGKAGKYQYVADFHNVGKNTCWEVRVFVDNRTTPVLVDDFKV